MKWLFGVLVLFVLLVSAALTDGQYTRLALTEARQEALGRDVTSDLARLDFDADGPQLVSISTHYRFYRSQTFYYRQWNTRDARCGRPIAFLMMLTPPTSILGRLLLGDRLQGEPLMETVGTVVGTVFEDRTFEMPVRPGQRLGPGPACL